MIDKLEHDEAVGEGFGYYFDGEGEIVDKVKRIGLEVEDVEKKEFMFGVAGGQ
ncbi:sugar-binding domain-containing protein [Staphylococcus epidermidis]|uniref:sugar-binding domain-containing protein n=1 Tax=Staphylococcus epidermidis TaxID=1282 RepID=UPI0021B1FC3D|nr:sugar-binding domain-containing protein [Staphylococcus epidermidis]